jgi:AcrR family transcriptional regulator
MCGRADERRPDRAAQRRSGRERRQEHAAATRELLVDAGLRMAEGTGLMGMTVNLIVEEAGVAKGTFFHHFGDRARFLVAIHREFHDRLFEELMRVVDGMPCGGERLLTGIAAFLDGCLRHRGIRALLLEARAEPAVADEIAERNRRAVRLTMPDFDVMGWTNPADGAALWNGLVVEAALLELAAGDRQPAITATLARFLPNTPTDR